MRRKTFKPRDQHLAEKMADISPSESHLFDEEALSKFFDQRGGFNKVFGQGQKVYEDREYQNPKPKFNRTPSSASFSQAQKSKAQTSAGSSSFRKPGTKDAKRASRDLRKEESSKKEHRFKRL